MLFNSLEFLVFLPIVFVLFWLTPTKWRYLPLLAASFFFYMYWNPKLVVLILFTMVVSYLCGILCEKAQNRPTLKKAVLALTIVTCFGILLFFKYFGFLFDSFNDLLRLCGITPIRGHFDILLPVGISFYTFQTASYVVDVYRGDFPAERHFGYYALFVTFFPQLVAGPIERPGDLLPQLHTPRPLSQLDYSGAFRFLLVGFFKKIAVADAVGLLVNAVYENPSEANGLASLIATLLFALQIYCDFSGYSDIAVGSAKLFGVELTENFRSPYLARSIKEFWNRWHLSLSRWLRDYLYFPLGGSRVKKGRWVFNTFVVFFVSGLWHGASYTYIVWGLLHAAFQVIGSFTLPWRDRFWKALGKEPSSRPIQAFRVFLTFLLVCFTWIFFRANSLSDAFSVIASIATDYTLSVDYLAQTVQILSLSLPMALYLLAAIALTLLTERIKYSHKTAKPLPRTLQNAAYLLMLWSTVGVWILLQANDVGSSFIYFQF